MSAAVKHRVVPSEVAQINNDLKLIRGSIRRGDLLSRGDRGADVRALQRALQDAGVYGGKVDGVFDQATEQAVRRFQRARGLSADGVVGPKTLASLKANNLYVQDGFETPAKRGQSGQDILAAERRLSALGYATGAVDGVFDAKTARAVKAYRAEQESLPDNKSTLDREVWRNLQQTYQSQVAPLQGVRRQRAVGSVREHRRLDDATARAAQAGELKEGARGRCVRNLQAHLKAAGADPGAIDGDFGPRTKRAVKSFQDQSGLPATGQVDARTWQALRDRLFAAGGRAAPAQSAGERGAAVMHTERQLDKLGFDPGKVDGWYNAGTASAVARFQRWRGLERTGQVDAGTLKALDKAVAIKDAEADLKTLGYKPGAVDGKATADTAAALRKFQRKEGLTVTGALDQRTDARLDKRAAEKRAAQRAGGPKPRGEAAKAQWYQALVKQAGGKWRSGVNEVNIVGLRGQSVDGARNHNTFNQWNDTIAYIWKGRDGKMHVREFRATTDPGFTGGTGVDANGDGRLDVAHLRPGSYPYNLGYHRGLYGAGNPGYNLQVDRDTNHDGHISRAERAASKRRDDRGYGINMHWGDGYVVGPYSAGCQVIKGSYDYFRSHVTPLMELNRGQMYYTLIDRSR
ncbi:MAG: peptidoglycan-binding protein [Deltaproteobacteria bacterium]|nr:peptidoglycan-binding protein [Deltaproteobacteria bacterium]